MTDYVAIFSELRNVNYVDWETAADEAAPSYTSYLNTWWGMTDDSALWTEAPYIVTYLEVTDQEPALTLTPKWDWAEDGDNVKTGRTSQCYNPNRPAQGSVFDYRHRIRGKGRVIQMYYESVVGKPFNLLGWSIDLDRNANY